MSSDSIWKMGKDRPVLTNPERKNNASINVARQKALDKIQRKIKAQQDQDKTIERFLSVPE